MPRIKFPERSTVHHVIARCTAGDFLLGETDREMLRNQLERTAAFCGVQVLAYVLLANHFHLLVRVPELDSRNALSQDAVLGRVGALYGANARKELQISLKSATPSDAKMARDQLDRYRALMCDLSQFMKLYKMRFSRWYNAVHGRFGTLWAERFRSLVVEDNPNAIQALAAYIDLNPVRAGLCDDPKDYRFCSYAEAIAVDGMARDGLKAVFATSDGRSERWDQVQARYRLLMFGKVSITSISGETGHVPAEKDRKGKSGVSAAKVRQVQDSDGELGLIEVFRQKIRHFAQGVALGSPDFVESVFQSRRKHFAAARKCGARKIRGAVGRRLSELRTLRDLRP
jgi:REP element-mobilizing transposase RayT